jgi:hypothetical protein
MRIPPRHGVVPRPNLQLPDSFANADENGCNGYYCEFGFMSTTETFPPFSMITYTLPALSLLLMVQQLHDIRQRCLKCAAVEDANHSLQEQDPKLLQHQQT